MKKLCGLLLWLIWSVAIAQGQEAAPANWTLLDQFDKPYTLNEDLRVLLVTRDMAGGRLINEALADRPQGYLEARHAAIVADISGMPAMISKLFAIPSMRDYSYRILLDHEPRVANRYPGKPDQVTWLQMEHGRVVSSQSFDSATKLREALESLPQ